MNTKISLNQPKSRKVIIIISLFIIVVPIIIQIISSCSNGYGEVAPTFINITRYAQDLFSDAIAIKQFVNVTQYINTLKIMILIIIIVYNYSNIYKSFVLFNIISFGNLIATIFKFVFLQNTPNFYKETYSFKIYQCGLGWGMPATQMLISTTFYLALWKIICIHLTNFIMKIIVFVLVILFLSFSAFCTILEGSFLFNQVLFSIIMGIGFYLLIFEGININLTEAKQFYKLIKSKIWKYLAFHMFFILILLIPYLILLYCKGSTNTYQKCIDILTEKPIFGESSSEQIEEGRRYYYHTTFTLLAFFLPNLFCIIAVKMELRFIFKDNYENWFQFNFSYEDNSLESEEMSLMGTISITRDTKWNNTSFGKSLFRLGIMIIFWVVFSLPYFFISWTESMPIVFIFKLFLPFSLYGFGGFFLFKWIFIKFNCVNGTLLSMIHEQSTFIE